MIVFDDDDSATPAFIAKLDYTMNPAQLACAGAIEINC